ncbi:DUF881 domain-containing protein [Clostridium sp. D2Q-14]|uniref:DUF881 domain-containing protein n=1 Tax=Anaeromonas gelatinilytica TaxID=2683194 RepID=UPI00193B692D|nr:DUF881 domain-containing protein [Anaeromonas gelatinilytica]MBS4535407.1 DUF881 domain-containing protein [Anaeromonas gelatinilytica]
MNKYIIKGIILIMCIFLGILIPYQIRNNVEDNSFVSLSTIKEKQNDVDKIKKEIIDIKKLTKEQEKKFQKLEDVNDTREMIEVLEKDIEKYKTLSGFNDLEGPGIVLTVQDSDKEYIYGESDSSGIVHDADIQNILNDLKVAGAEAISISGQRVILNSPVKCGGPVIRVNNKNLIAPFVIRAIGDSKKLYAAIDAPGAYGRYLNDSRDLKLEIKEKSRIVVPRYSNTLEINYMKLVEEGE